MIHENLKNFREALQEELRLILLYWEKKVQDEIDGGFYGRINHGDKVQPGAPKGSVLNSRILWAFSAAYNYTKEKKYKLLAQRAFDYFIRHFIDEEYGGVYWTVDYKGVPLDTKKQTYAISFAVYGLSEYYKCSHDPLAKEKAIDLYNDILAHTADEGYGGYFEAFSRDWSAPGDQRLSAKDADEKKSMNTHLHVIEAFANLYTIWPEKKLKQQINQLLEIFTDHIIDKKNLHLRLFFSENWTVRSDTISYGHDIEAAWLLQEAAEIIGDKSAIASFKKISVDIAVAAKEGLDKDGGIWYEYEPGKELLIKEKHWWPQAEAMIGFVNAWEVSGDISFLQNALDSWKFIKEHIKDNAGGEWVWGVYEDYAVMAQEDKAGLWKCPYHNTRACIEIMKRIDSMENMHENKN